MNLNWEDMFPRTASLEVRGETTPEYVRHVRFCAEPDPRLAEYMRQMHEGIAAQHEVKALHLLFFALCHREGGSITLSDEDLEEAQRLGPYGVGVRHDPGKGVTTITPYRK